jgi:hypothetical protein
MRKYLYLIISVAFFSHIYAQQLDIKTDYRARYEMRNGYATLRPDSLSAGNFITQRARITFEN